MTQPSMRDILNRLETPKRDILLENKKQYMQMMQPLVDVGVIGQPQMTVVDAARKLLKRNDRIVWWLSWYRVMKLLSYKQAYDSEMERTNSGYEPTSENIANYAKIIKMISKYTKNMPETTLKSEMGGFELYWMLEGNYLNHMVALLDQISAWNDYVWAGTPHDLYEIFNNIEQKWQEGRDQIVNPQDMEDEVVIDMGNGQGWVLLRRDYCSAEGEAMGHCGNRQGGRDTQGTILSFRTVISDTEHKPHMTFILDSEGYLGEMKGRANEKPAAKYHKAIVKLLLDDRVKGIKGGGHDPANNFAMEDLTEEQQDFVYAKKPVLEPLNRYYKNHGWDDITKEKLIATVDMHLGFEGLTDEGFIADRFDDFGNFGKEYDFGNLEYIGDIMSGDRQIDSYGDVYDGNITDMFDALPFNIKGAIKQILFRASDEYNDWPEDEYDEGMDEMNITREIMSGGDEEITDAFNNASYSGVDVGTEEDMMKSLESWRDGDNYKIIGDGWDGGTKLEILVTFKQMLEHVVNPPSYGEFVEFGEDEENWRDIHDIEDVEQPLYGWSGFNEEVAVEQVEENLPDHVHVLADEIYKERIKNSNPNDFDKDGKFKESIQHYRLKD